MKPIETDDAPSSIGPFSQAIVEGGMVYVSGQGPVDLKTDEIVSDDPKEQTARTLQNVGAILEAAGSSLDDVVRTAVYLTDMDDYDAVNRIYEDFMSEPYPARTAVEVSRLPIDIAVELDVIASC